MDILSKCWKVKSSSALSEKSPFYDVEKPGTFGVPIQIYGASKKRELPQKNRDEWDSYAFGATTLIKDVTTCHALRHNINIQKICDIFCPHTADCYEPTPTHFSELTKSVSFASVRFDGVRRVLGTPFPFKSSGGKCECFVRHWRRHVYLPFVSYIEHRTSSVFIKIKNYNQTTPGYVFFSFP